MWFKLEKLEHAGGIALRISELDSKVEFSFILTETDMKARNHLGEEAREGPHPEEDRQVQARTRGHTQSVTT